jgi:hypothetical protein
MTRYRRVASLSGLIVTAALVALRPAVIQAQSAQDSTLVITSGSGHVTLSPDRATVRAGIASSGARAADASATASAKVRTVVDALVAMGLMRDSVRIVGWNVGPEYDPQTRRIGSYTARATVQVTVRDLAMLGRVLDAVLGAGASALEGVSFQSDSTDSGRRQALVKAFDDARAQAEALAGAAGGRLGRLVQVSTEGREIQPMSGVAMMGRVGAMPISAEDIEVQATVFTRWELRLGAPR